MPALNMSALQPYPWSFNISGATYPGDPHLMVRSPSLFEAESPKSTILSESMLSFLKSKFSGFKSRCTMFLECMATSAFMMHLMIMAASFSLYWPVFLILSKSSPPCKHSKTKCMLCWDSYTSWRWMIFSWSSFLSKFTSCNRANYEIVIVFSLMAA